MIVTLLGSTRFKKEHDMEVARILRAGDTPIPLIFNEFVTEELDKEFLDKNIRVMIDLCDRIHVVNPYGYMGVSVLTELAYAKKKGKFITWSHLPDVGEQLYNVFSEPEKKKEFIGTMPDESPLCNPKTFLGTIYATCGSGACHKIIKLKYGDFIGEYVVNDSDGNCKLYGQPSVRKLTASPDPITANIIGG